MTRESQTHCKSIRDEKTGRNKYVMQKSEVCMVLEVEQKKQQNLCFGSNYSRD